MPVARRLNIGLRPAWFDGAPKIKIKSRSKAGQIKSESPAGADGLVGADRGYEGCEGDWPDTPLFAAFGSSYKELHVPPVL
jgi:hypothetical protein